MGLKSHLTMSGYSLFGNWKIYNLTILIADACIERTMGWLETQVASSIKLLENNRSLTVLYSRTFKFSKNTDGKKGSPVIKKLIFDFLVRGQHNLYDFYMTTDKV